MIGVLQHGQYSMLTHWNHDAYRQLSQQLWQLAGRQDPRWTSAVGTLVLFKPSGAGLATRSLNCLHSSHSALGLSLKPACPKGHGALGGIQKQAYRCPHGDQAGIELSVTAHTGVIISPSIMICCTQLHSAIVIKHHNSLSVQSMS